MPISVSVPTKIRLDETAVTELALPLENALSAAVGRALANSRKSVLDARGGSDNVYLNEPTFTWSGATVSTTDRTHVERLVTDLIRAAAKLEGLSSSELPGNADGAVAANPSRQPAPSDTPGPVVEFRTAQPNWTQLDLLFELYMQALLIDDTNPHLPMPAPGVVGLLFAHPTGGYLIVFYNVPDPGRVVIEGIDKPSFSLACVEWPIGRPFGVDVSADTGTLDLHEFESAVPLSESYTFTFVPAATEAARRAFRQQRLRNKLLEQASAERFKLRPPLSDVEFAARVDELVARRMELLEDDPSLIGFAILDPGGLIPVTEWPAALGYSPILILPCTEVIPQDEIERRASGTGQTGTATMSPSTGTGTSPFGTNGADAKPVLPGDPAAPAVDCSDSYETKYSALYPESYLDDDDHLKCRPLLGEPKLELLGEYAKPLQAEIARLTAELGLATCGSYAGSFCLGVGQAIVRRARELGEQAAAQAASEGAIRATSDGNLGFVQFDPESTPPIQELHRLAGLLDDVIELGDDMKSLYALWWPNLCGRWYQHSSQWALAFSVLFHPIRNDAVGNLFKSTCRIVLLQLLETSRSQITARKLNITTYAPLFEFLFRAYFTDKSELEKLKSRLQLSTQLLGGLTNPAGSWLDLSTSLLAEFDKAQLAQPSAMTIKDDLVYNADQRIVGIQDEHGNVWTKSALEQALSQREYLVESIDPMIKQFSASEATFILGLLNNNVTFAFKSGLFGPALNLGDMEKAILSRVVGTKKISVETVVGAILDQMQAENASRARKTREDFDYAFDNAPLHESTKAARIPYCTFALQGIHKLADEQIGSAFRLHQNQYGWELNDVLSARAGAESLASFFKGAGVAVLSIVCPPLGVVAGAAMAISDYEKALEKKSLFRSLIDPDLVITRAEVEAELFAAELGLVLTFLPHSKSILGAAGRGIQVVSKQGVRGSARAVVSQIRRALTRDAAQAAAAAIRERFALQVADAIKDDFAVALSKELIQNELMDVFMGKLLIDPIVNSIYDEFQDYSSGYRSPGLITRTFGQGEQ